jgi:hypothetical protein
MKCPFCSEAQYPGDRHPGERGRGHRSPPPPLPGLRQALHHLRARRAAHAAHRQEERQPRRLRPRQAAGQPDAGPEEAPGHHREHRRRHRAHRGAPACQRRARGADREGGRAGHARAAQARQDRLRALRLGLPQLRGRRGVPRGDPRSEEAAYAARAPAAPDWNLSPQRHGGTEKNLMSCSVSQCLCG